MIKQKTIIYNICLQWNQIWVGGHIFMSSFFLVVRPLRPPPWKQNNKFVYKDRNSKFVIRSQKNLFSSTPAQHILSYHLSTFVPYHGFVVVFFEATCSICKLKQEYSPTMINLNELPTAGTLSCGSG